MDYKSIFNSFINREESEVSFQPITDGHINTTLQATIKDNNGRHEDYILQKINHHVFRKPAILMQSIATVNNCLAEKEYDKEILEFLPNVEGKFLTIDENGDFWRLSKFIPDTYTVTKVKNEVQAFEAAKTLSLFYAKLLDMDPSTIESSIPGFTDFAKRIVDYQKALPNASEERLAKAASEIAFVNEHLSLPEKFITSQNDGTFPLRIVHADPKISNVLFDSTTDKGRCVIDLDTLMPATILYDFGDMVRSYTNLREEDDPTAEQVFSPAYYKAVKSGFLTYLEDKLTEAEIENLDYAGQVVVFIQAVRFLTDYLDNDQYYHTDYAEHNLDRTKNQLNLLKELLA